MAFDYTLLDRLASNGHSFALYRIPGRKTLVLVLQKEGRPEIIERMSGLNGKNGFVAVPFRIQPSHPVVLIRPDVVREGESAVFKYLEKIDPGAGTASECLSSDETIGTETKFAPADSDFSNYQSAFELFIRALNAGSCQKIVLSRTHRKARPAGFSAGKMFKKAFETYPDAFVYFCHTPVTGTWMGSTPEMLLSGASERWRTVSLAGTRVIGGGSAKSTKSVSTAGSAKTNGGVSENGPFDVDAPWDEKNIREQQIVSTFVEKQLRIKDIPCEISSPYTVVAGNLQHLRTDFSFHLDDESPLGDLLDALHPTPAVCGHPKREAYRLILAQEGFDRSYYSGFVGPLQLHGQTHLFVNIRCLRVDANELVFFAGGGLMPDSELESEWKETEAKLQTLLSILETTPCTPTN